MYRSHTSDNVETWKKQRWAESEKRKEERRSEKRKSQKKKKKMQEREKVKKSRNSVFFQCFVAQEGRKVGSLKRRVRSHLVSWAIKNCTPLWREQMSKTPQRGNTLKLRCWTPLWREARFEAKTYNKTHHVQSIIGSWDVEKVHAVAARSTFPSQNHFWKLTCRKNCMLLWRETNLEVKSVKKTDGLGPLSDAEMSKKWTLTLTPTLALTLQLHLQLQLQLHALKDTTTTTRHTLQLQLPLQLQLRLQLHDTTLIYATLATTH